MSGGVDVWGGSWGDAWGASWTGTLPVLDSHVASGGGWTDRRREPLTAARDERKRQQIAAELKALYREVYEKAAPDSEAADRAAAVVAEYAPVKAPDFPPPDVVDWLTIASEGVATVAALRNQLRDIQRGLARLAAEEDDIEVLLLTAM